MKFVKMYVKNNRELKKVNDNVILDIRTREFEDLSDINRQVYRLEKNGYKVILQSPKGRLLPSRALGKYTKHQVNIELGGLSHNQVIAKLANIKGMMSHKEYVDIPVYEESYPSAFDYKVPKTDEDGNIIVNTVEKTVYLDRVYTITVNGKYCHNKKYKKLAKSFKIPLATVVGDQVVDPDDQSYLLHDCTENVIKLIKEKYETISPVKKEMLLEFFGTHDPDISDFEDFAYAMINFKMFRVDGLPLPNKVDAVRFNNMLGAFKVPNAYDIMYDLAEKGMLVNLEDFPELRQFEEVRFYEDSYVEDDILD